MEKLKLSVLSSLLCLVLVFLLACTPSATPTLAPTTSPTTKPTSTTAPVSFAGKTVTVVVANSAASQTDMGARLYGRFLSMYLPGKPSVIVRDMPGGANTVGVNYVYGAAPDGLTILSTGGSAALNQLVGAKAARYDVLKMPGLMASASSIVVYMKRGIVNNPEDIAKAKGVIFGGSAGAGGYFFICAHEVLNFPVEKVVVAYSGAGDALRALLAGEVNMSVGGYLEMIMPYAVKGEVMPLFQNGLLDEKGNLVKDPALPPEILTVKELYEKIYGKSPSGITWDTYKTLVAASRNYADCLFLPPRTPDNIVKIYWDAVEKLVKDPEFLNASARLSGAGVLWKAGEAYDKEFKLNFGIKPEIVDFLRATLPKYGMSVE